MRNTARTLIRIAAISFLWHGSLAAAQECAEHSDTPAPDVIRTAFRDDVDLQHAPAPTNYSERVLFRHLYETLLRPDCKAELAPALADSWHSSEDGRRWSFQLREDARFWDGVPVTARAVISSWAHGAAARRLASLRGGPVIVQPNGELELVISTARPAPELPAALAHPELAVVRAGTPRWPIGTGPYRMAGEGRGPSGSSFSLTSGGSDPHAPGVVEFAVGRTDRDPRALLAGATAVDLIVTDDPLVIRFARAEPELTVQPLAWDRTYALLVFSLADTSTPAIRSAAQLSRSFLEALAGEAVDRDARAAQPPYWWVESGACESGVQTAPTGEATGSRKSNRIVYMAGDETARQLAGRLVSLLDSSSGADVDSIAHLLQRAHGVTQTAAVPLAQQELSASLRGAAELGYIVSLPRLTLEACQDLIEEETGAGFLAAVDRSLAPILVPLVDTRNHLIARAGTPALTVDWDAVPLLYSISR